MSFNINWERLNEESANETRIYLEQSLNNVRPDFLDYIEIPTFSFGTCPPEIEISDISNPLPTFYEKNELHRAQFDTQIVLNVKYSGDLSFIIRTGLHMNYPNVSFMILPLELKIYHISFYGDFIISYINEKVIVCFKENPLVDIKVETELGDEQKLKNISKVQKFIIDVLKKIITEKMVYPNFKSFKVNKMKQNEEEKTFQYFDEDELKNN